MGYLFATPRQLQFPRIDIAKVEIKLFKKNGTTIVCFVFYIIGNRKLFYSNKFKSLTDYIYKKISYICIENKSNNILKLYKKNLLKQIIWKTCNRW